jgi:hypothetical protein
MDQSGVLGRVTVDPALANAKTRLLRGDKGAPTMKATSGARIVRPAGILPLEAATEPMPELKLVLKGAESKAADPPTKVVFESGNFSPRHALMPNPGPLAVENKSTQEITLLNAKGEKMASIPPNSEQAIQMAAGEQALKVKLMPHAEIRLVVLQRSAQIPLDAKTGRLVATPVASGDYELAFYLGADALRVHPVKVPAAGALNVEASVSDKEVVTVTAKTNATGQGAP